MRERGFYLLLSGYAHGACARNLLGIAMSIIADNDKVCIDRPHRVI